MMRVGILDGGMEVEHMKRRHANSVSSVSSEAPSLMSSNASSAASSSDDLASLVSEPSRLRQRQLNSQGPHPAAPFGQPQAAVADKYTLSVPPSEKFRIVSTVPEIRPGLLNRVNRLDSVTRADASGEVGVLVGAQA